MVKIIFALMALSVPIASYADDHDTPTQLVLQVDGLSKKDLRLGQRYASCMSVPRLPIAVQLENRAKTCADFKAPRSPKLKKVMRWVDHIAVQFAGREIDLQIRRR